MDDRLALVDYGDGYRLVYCRTVREGNSYITQASPLGVETFEQPELQELKNFGVMVSDRAIKEFYQSLKIRFEGSKDPLKEHHEDMRKIAFGLLDVLKK
jgi:hypothetical protein